MKPFLSALGLVVPLVLVTGCQQLPAAFTDVGPTRQVVNHGGVPRWPASIQRVAVLPVHDTRPAHPAAFISQFDAEWISVLQATHRAEFVAIERATLAAWTGPAGSVNSTAALPHDLPGRIAAHTEADAVIFLDLLPARTTPPLAWGLRMKLVSLTTGAVLWSADELFDQADGATARTSRWQARRSYDGPGDPTFGPAQSPGTYLRQCAETLLAKLPPRHPWQRRR